GDEQTDFPRARRRTVIVELHGAPTVWVLPSRLHAARGEAAPYNRGMANLVTLSRLLLLIVVVVLSYVPPTPWQFANFFLIILIFVSDGFDGYVARKRNETSLFGALFDIAGDRIVELTLWLVAADTDLVRAWVPLVFIWRGVIVDTIRSSNAVAQGMAPFALMRSRFGKLVVAGKFVRGLYAVVK